MITTFAPLTNIIDESKCHPNVKSLEVIFKHNSWLQTSSHGNPVMVGRHTNIKNNSAKGLCFLIYCGCRICGDCLQHVGVLVYLL